MDVILQDDERIDQILGGLRLIQRERGYRFSVDALLLASFVSLQKGDDVIELGVGSGIVCLMMAQHPGIGRVVGVEIQERLFEIAVRNISLNSMDGRVKIIRGDVRRPASLCGPQTFSVAVFNPPYRRVHSGRVNPDAEKAVARHEISGTVAHFVAAASWALRLKGHMYVIYPATRMAELIKGMLSAGIEPKRLRPVYSRPGDSAAFILVEGIKAGGEGLNILPPLVIYDEKGGYTDEMNEIFRNLSSSVSPCGV